MRFNDPMTEIYLMFYQSVLPVFTQLSLFLQREEPCVHLVKSQIMTFIQNLLEKFVKISKIKESDNLADVDYLSEENQLLNTSIFVGFLTRTTLNKLVDQGDVGPEAKVKFYDSVRAFYVKAASEAMAKLPHDDIFLEHAQFIEFRNRESQTFESVEFLLKSIQTFLNTVLKK